MTCFLTHYGRIQPPPLSPSFQTPVGITVQHLQGKISLPKCFWNMFDPPFLDIVLIQAIFFFFKIYLIIQPLADIKTQLGII